MNYSTPWYSLIRPYKLSVTYSDTRNVCHPWSRFAPFADATWGSNTFLALAPAHRLQLLNPNTSLVDITWFYIWFEMSSTNSRAPSRFEGIIFDVTADQAREPNVEETRHPQYYFEDGNIVFQVSYARYCGWWTTRDSDFVRWRQVESVLYSVHRYFFARDSAHFRNIFKNSKDAQFSVLSDVTCADFNEFLAILYPT